MKSVIQGTGSYLPSKILTNADLEKIVDTSDEWIFQRTGIRQRHVVSEGETTSTLAIEAARRALEASGLNAEDIDGVIVATTTPDLTFPSVAVHVQEALGLPANMAFDIQAVCTGFVYAISTAHSFLQTGQAKNILVIGAETMSRILDWTDRTTCVLFGDGAGAVVLSAVEGEKEDRGIISTHLYADGRKKGILCTSGGVSKTQDAGMIEMQGRDVFKYAVKLMHDVVDESLSENGYTGADLDWLVPHQANVRIISATADKLGLPMEKVVMTVSKHGNTSAASIPLALDQAVRAGQIQRNQLILLEALGGGLTWGATLLRF
ncbi:MAG: ketoacyl-ACP synthase III [Alphaproteobacteria bacterium]|nr:ketoacyl-ACP synthase III [Alphaproteobacteria bacterium]